MQSKLGSASWTSHTGTRNAAMRLKMAPVAVSRSTCPALAVAHECAVWQRKGAWVVMDDSAGAGGKLCAPADQKTEARQPAVCRPARHVDQHRQPILPVCCLHLSLTVVTSRPS